MPRESIEASLEWEQLDRIKRILDQAGVTDPNVARSLAKDVTASMSAYAQTAEYEATRFREAHDKLRALWTLAQQDDPPIGLIRGRLKELPTTILSTIEERAQRLWPVIFDNAAPPDFVRGWMANLPGDRLVEALQRSISGGGVQLPGRRRGAGKRSKPRYEPPILGIARGSRTPSGLSGAKGALGGRPARLVPNGRPADDAAVWLIGMLAVDWLKSTDQKPAAGRSDETPFGDLVHQVFGWLDLAEATGALRRYWREYNQRKQSPKG